MSTLYLLNKPYQVLSQFTDKKGRKTLADYISIPKVYPAGRLDYDSEGLLVLTGDGALQARIANPKYKLRKHYWVQLEGTITEKAIKSLESGVILNDGITAPAIAKIIGAPKLWKRNPPIRERANSATSWIEISITEGRNRQIRRMTAEVGYPALRLIRHKIGSWSIDSLNPGEFRKQTIHLPKSQNNVRKARPHNQPRK